MQDATANDEAGNPKLAQSTPTPASSPGNAAPKANQICGIHNSGKSDAYVNTHSGSIGWEKQVSDES